MQRLWNLSAWRAARSLLALLALTVSCVVACTAHIDGDPSGGLPLGASSSDGPAGSALLCQSGLTACGASCVDLSSASDNCGACGAACSAPAVCAQGSCDSACAQGFEKCGASCVNPLSDAANCGACGKQCDAGQPCYSGVCGCPEGVLFCQGQCYDPKSDSAHCGSCENACQGGAACVDGNCECGADEQLCGSECSNLNTPRHCGSCNEACAAGEICAAGSCIPEGQPCPVGLTRCGDACVNLQSASSSCGSCDNHCSAGQACAGGQCACPDGKTSCANNCVDLSSSPLHCGGCADSCSAGQTCSAGQCRCAAATDVVCDGACTDPKSDAEHCGDCLTRCQGGLPCTEGKCACPEGETPCAGACVVTDSSAEHCGGCGMACPAGESCLAGKCSGAIGDACDNTLASAISITEIAVYQAGKIPIMQNDAALDESERPADIIQGKAARVRVFVKLESGWSNRTVSARLLLTNDADTPSYFSKRNVSQGSTDNSLATTFNFDVEPQDITPTTRYAVEIVECDGSPAGTPGKPRFPASGNQALGTRQTGTIKLRFIPLNANGRSAASDSARLDLYRDYLLRMYPTTAVEISVGDTLNISRTISAQGSGWSEALDQLSNLHEDDQAGNDLYYYGLFQPSDSIGQYCGGGCVAGIGYVAGQQSSGRHQRVALGLSFANISSAQTLAHELGHNHGRPHSPCGGAAGADDNYPYEGAKIGWWGFEAPETLHNPANDTDIMGYCKNQWVSDYVYRAFTDRIALLNGAQQVIAPPPAELRHFRFLLTDVDGPRWGIQRRAARSPSGDAESADILDAAGQLVTQVTVYRTPLDHLGGALLLVPDPEPGWHAVQIRGEVPLGFDSSAASLP